MKVHRYVVLVLAGILLGLGVTASEVVELIDQTGAVVRIDGPVDRIVSVYGIGTYYLYALGAADGLVGGGYVGVKSVAQAADAILRLEPRFEELFIYGDPNVEEILRRDPQLVLVDGSRHAAFAQQMTDLGVPAIQYLVETPEEFAEALRLTGEALGSEASARAEAFLAELDRVLEQVEEDLADVADDERVRVLFIGTAPLQVATGAMYQTDLIGLAGGLSVTSDLVGYWSEVNLEQILLWDPDVIVIPPYGPVQPADLIENPDWASIEAVRSGRVYRMPRLMAPMDTPVPESLLGVVWMAGVFYPGLVSLDLADEAARFYADYYSFDLTEEDLALLVGE
jgi:iron complex transport system substrate-binding protein